MSHDCAYCFAPVARDAEGSWADETQGDCCAGDALNVNENGVHNVFDPAAGYADVCVEFLPDPYADNEGTCFRCFHHIHSHEKEN